MSRCFSTIDYYSVCQFFVYKSSVGLFLCFCCQFISMISMTSIFSMIYISFQFLADFCDPILLLYVFQLAIDILSFCNIVSFILYHFFYTFFCLYQPNLHSVFHRSFIILLYSLNMLFTETNWSWQIYELRKDLEIRTSIASSVDFPNNTVLWFFLFFFTINLYFLIAAVVSKIYISTAELVMTVGTETKEANTETEIQPVTVKLK